MSRSNTVAVLRAAGFEPAEAESRAALIASARSVLEPHSSAAPGWSWFAPGRIEIFGKHTDYAGGRSLVAAVPRGFAIVARPRQDRIVQAVDARWHESMTLDPADTSTVFTGWRNYIAVVARRLQANFPGADFGLDIGFASDLPRAAGLSSSSALVVGVATALVRRAMLDARAEWRDAVETDLDLAGYLGAVENGLHFKSLPGTSGVGTHGGSEDHTAILTCRAGQAHAYPYVPVTAVGVAAVPASWRFVIVASGVQADKAGSARDRYNRASLATQALVEIGRRETGADVRSLTAFLSSRPDGAAVLRACLARGDSAGGFPSTMLEKRLAHFLAEDARVAPALDAFRQEDAAAIGELAAGSQHDAETLLENQIPETSTLAAAARAEGAWAATSFGAGFGGSVWALAPAEDADALAKRWVAAYLRKVTPPGPVDAFVCRPGSGLIEIPESPNL